MVVTHGKYDNTWFIIKNYSRWRFIKTRKEIFNIFGLAYIYVLLCCEQTHILGLSVNIVWEGFMGS